jgi:hypothetical protein
MVQRYATASSHPSLNRAFSSVAIANSIGVVREKCKKTEALVFASLEILGTNPLPASLDQIGQQKRGQHEQTIGAETRPRGRVDVEPLVQSPRERMETTATADEIRRFGLHESDVVESSFLPILPAGAPGGLLPRSR